MSTRIRHATAEAEPATARMLDRPDVWYAIAEDGGGRAGQCGFHPAHEMRNMRGARVEGAAWVWHLFVRPDLWGSGLAAQLHDLALAEMRERGYGEARLSTPEGQARSRRFYEKHGWRRAFVRERRGQPHRPAARGVPDRPLKGIDTPRERASNGL